MNIKIELAQAIVNYLGTKPYQEVFLLIQELQKQANVLPETETENEKKD